MNAIFQDWQANSGNPRGRFVLVLFRAAQLVRRWPAPFWYLGAPVIALYSAVSCWIYGIELDCRTRVGPRLRLYHGAGLVVNRASVLGSDVTLRHCTTLGNRTPDGPCPQIGNGVDIGCNAVILGGVAIGDGAKIGAGAVVLFDVPASSTAAGNPARIVHKRPVA